MTNYEQPDEQLKRKSEEWWSNHSQDYLENSSEYYMGAKLHLSDKDFIDYLDDIDRYFKRDAYFAQERHASLFKSLLPAGMNGKKVLEVGCGLGSHSEQISKSGASLTAIDLSNTSVEATKRRFNIKSLNGKILKADAENLPFEDNAFDIVWSWGVIHHTPNTEKCAEEIERVLKPNGELRIMLYHKSSLYSWLNVYLKYGILSGKLFKHTIQELRNLYTDGRHIGGAPLSKYYTKNEVRSLFNKINFQSQISFEQKKVISNIFPKSWRSKIEYCIPDKFYTFLMARVGFLLFSIGNKIEK